MNFHPPHPHHDHPKKPRILFILKDRQTGLPGEWNYCTEPGQRLSSGLYNSVRFIVDMLKDNDVEAKLVHVVDNNGIDKEVHQYKPTHVIIEAYWVVPEKFDVLMRLHPKVKWIVRDHSKTEFLASEGIAFGWTLEYMKRGIEISCNSLEAVADMRKLAVGCGFNPNLVTYSPNYYPLYESYNPAPKQEGHQVFTHSGWIDIGCFGAIRPLKNNVNQAIAAIDFANDIGGKMRFHINSTRVEGMASPILKNIREIFARTKIHQLVEHEWMDHHDFRHMLKRMEIVSQVTFSETFNIVAADAVSVGVPVVGSAQIPWLQNHSVADPNSVESISRRYRSVWKDTEWGYFPHQQYHSLLKYSQTSKDVWMARFGTV
jgi:hypothetical protein